MNEAAVRKSVPDGGFGWFICAAASLVHFVLSGIQNNTGILYIYILKEFSGGKARSAWVGSTHFFALYVSAPFVTAACDRWGCRLTGFVGGLLAIAAVAGSSAVTELYMLFVTYGALFGIGASFCYVTTFRILSDYFEKHLSLVNGICTGAGYAGTIVLGPCILHLARKKGLFRTLAALAGITSVTAMAALLYRQPPTATGEARLKKTSVKSVKELFDVSLLKCKPFLVLVLGMSIYVVGAYIPAMHGPSFARESGILEENVAYLPVAWSASSCFFSFCIGKISDKLRAHRLEILQITMFGVAVSIVLYSAASSVASFVVIMVMYGAFDCGFVLLKAVIVEDVVGSDRASRGVGFLFGSLSIAYLSGPPLTGWIFDVTKSYPLSFLVISVASIIGCCILFLIPVLQSSEKRSLVNCFSKTEPNTVELSSFWINLAETTRLIFKAAGVDFEDRRLTGEEWAKFKTTGEAPFEQLPLLRVDGKVIAQSPTISRFVANEVGLAPSSNLQKAQADMIVDGCVYFRSKFRGPLLEKDETKKAKLQEDLKEFVPKQLEMFENLLKTNNGGEGYFVGDKLSYADLMFFNIMNSAFSDGKLEITDERVKVHPLLLKHYSRVMNIPAVKKWLQERPQTAN